MKHTGTIDPKELAEEMKTEMADVEEDYLEMVSRGGGGGRRRFWSCVIVTAQVVSSYKLALLVCSWRRRVSGHDRPLLCSCFAVASRQAVGSVCRACLLTLGQTTMKRPCDFLPDCRVVCIPSGCLFDCCVWAVVYQSLRAQLHSDGLQVSFDRYAGAVAEQN